jgi:hypothetical protein
MYVAPGWDASLYPGVKGRKLSFYIRDLSAVVPLRGTKAEAGESASVSGQPSLWQPGLRYCKPLQTIARLCKVIPGKKDF